MLFPLRNFQGLCFTSLGCSCITRFCWCSRVYQSLHGTHWQFLLIDRDATLAHKAEALELQRQLRRLQTQYDLLTGQSSALIQGRRARVAATSAVSGQITAIEDSLSARNLQVWYMSYTIVKWNAIILVFDKFVMFPFVFYCDLDEWSSRKTGFHFSRAGALSFWRRCPSYPFSIFWFNFFISGELL